MAHQLQVFVNRSTAQRGLVMHESYVCYRLLFGLLFGFQFVIGFGLFFLEDWFILVDRNFRKCDRPDFQLEKILGFFFEKVLFGVIFGSSETSSDGPGTSTRLLSGLRGPMGADMWFRAWRESVEFLQLASWEFLVSSWWVPGEFLHYFSELDDKFETIRSGVYLGVCVKLRLVEKVEKVENRKPSSKNITNSNSPKFSEGRVWDWGLAK